MGNGSCRHISGNYWSGYLDFLDSCRSCLSVQTRENKSWVFLRFSAITSFDFVKCTSNSFHKYFVLDLISDNYDNSIICIRSIIRYSFKFAYEISIYLLSEFIDCQKYTRYFLTILVHAFNQLSHQESKDLERGEILYCSTGIFFHAKHLLFIIWHID